MVNFLLQVKLPDFNIGYDVNDTIRYENWIQKLGFRCETFYYPDIYSLPDDQVATLDIFSTIFISNIIFSSFVAINQVEDLYKVLRKVHCSGQTLSVSHSGNFVNFEPTSSNSRSRAFSEPPQQMINEQMSDDALLSLNRPKGNFKIAGQGNTTERSVSSSLYKSNLTIAISGDQFHILRNDHSDDEQGTASPWSTAGTPATSYSRPASTRSITNPSPINQNLIDGINEMTIISVASPRGHSKLRSLPMSISSVALNSRTMNRISEAAESQTSTPNSEADAGREIQKSITSDGFKDILSSLQELERKNTVDSDVSTVLDDSIHEDDDNNIRHSLSVQTQPLVQDISTIKTSPSVLKPKPKTNVSFSPCEIGTSPSHLLHQPLRMKDHKVPRSDIQSSAFGAPKRSMSLQSQKTAGDATPSNFRISCSQNDMHNYTTPQQVKLLDYDFNSFLHSNGASPLKLEWLREKFKMQEDARKSWEDHLKNDTKTLRNDKSPCSLKDNALNGVPNFMNLNKSTSDLPSLSNGKLEYRLGNGSSLGCDINMLNNNFAEVIENSPQSFVKPFEYRSSLEASTASVENAHFITNRRGSGIDIHRFSSERQDYSFISDQMNESFSTPPGNNSADSSMYSPGSSDIIIGSKPSYHDNVDRKMQRSKAKSRRMSSCVIMNMKSRSTDRRASMAFCSNDVHVNRYHFPGKMPGILEEDKYVNFAKNSSETHQLIGNQLVNLNIHTFLREAIVIGGCFQRLFDNNCPVVIAPMSCDKRIVEVSLSSSMSNLKIRLFIPNSNEDAKWINLGEDWLWLHCSPMGYLVAKGGVFTEKKTIFYYLPKHPMQWSTFSAIDNLRAGFLENHVMDVSANDDFDYGGGICIDSLNIDKAAKSDIPASSFSNISSEIIICILSYLPITDLYPECLTVQKTWSLAIYKILAAHANHQRVHATNIPWKKFSEFLDEHKRGKFLSEGACKRVYRVKQTTSNISDAVSIMDVKDLSARGMETAITTELEISMLCSALNTLHICPNMVKIHSVFQSDRDVSKKLWNEQRLSITGNETIPSNKLNASNFTRGQFQYIHMEFCDGGDVETFLRRKGDFDVETIRSFIFQMMFALYAARESVSLRHYDIKLLNFFLSKGQEMNVGFGKHLYHIPCSAVEPSIIKLADFGTSVIGSRSLANPITMQQV